MAATSIGDARSVGEMQTLTVVIESFIGNQKAEITVAELGVALTVANRIVNRIATQERGYQPYYRYEPALVSLEVREIRTGSVVLHAAMEIANNPFAQGVAGGVLANNLTPIVNTAIKSAASALRRLGRASAGRTIQLTIRFGQGALRVCSEFREGGQSSIQVRVIPDDVQ